MNFSQIMTNLYLQITDLAESEGYLLKQIPTWQTMPKPTDPSKWTHMFTDDIKFTQKILLFHPTQPQKFLTLIRSPQAKTRPQAMDLPGGNVLYSENSLESILREIKEETGITDIPTPQILHFKGIYRPEKAYYLIATGYKSLLKPQHLNQIRLSSEHTNYTWTGKIEFLNQEPHWFLKELVDKI